ncbi:DUF475 domain-containing protein [Rhodococcus aerolatus]
MHFKIFGVSLVVTVVALLGALLLGGPAALAIVAILIVLEISLSFDNAVVNATILKRMNEFWQRIFLTVGVLIAVFGMRLLFPLVLVSITAKINPVEVVRLAIDGGPVEEPGTYANLLTDAHPAIAGFGGLFLGMLFLDWLFEEKEITWLSWLEKPLQRIGSLDQLSVVVAGVALVVAALTLAPDGKVSTVMVSGILGMVTYLLVNGLGSLFEESSAGEGDADDDAAPAAAGGSGGSVGAAAGKAAFFLFLYLEVLDASFSFDGVVGAFAISQDIFIIAVGLGVGAFWIRSLTVYLVRQGTLDDYVYLEAGAHWAIGALAVLLLVTIEYEVPEVVTGLIGVGFIGAAFLNSVVRNRRIEARTGEKPHVDA